MKKKLAALITMMVILTLGIASMAYAVTQTTVNTTAYVAPSNGGYLNVRANPDSDAKVTATLSYGTQVTVLEFTDSVWSRILYVQNRQNAIGYVMTRYLSFTKPGSSSSYTPTATAVPSSSQSLSILSFNTFQSVTPYRVYARPTYSTGWVNMRWAPSMFVDVIQRCYKDYELVVIAQNNGWAQVLDPKTNKVGFMDRNYLSGNMGYVTITVK